MKSDNSTCTFIENDRREIRNKLRSCRSEVSRLEAFSRDQIENEIRAQSVLDAAVDGIVIISEQGVIQSFNPAAEKIFGYRQKEVTGRNVSILMPEPHRSAHDNYIRSYLETGRRKIIGIGRETVAQRKDGTTFPVELAISEVVLDGQRIFTGIIKDITRRRQSAKALKESEERFRLLVETMNDGLAVQDAGDRIIYVNPRFCEILGYKRRCLLNRRVAELMDSASRIVLQSELTGDQAGGMVELKMKKDNGEPLHVHVTAKAIRSPGGDLKGSFVVITDVTQVKKLQHQLIQSQKMEAIGRLAGGIAHDFNNLLTVILGFADLSLESVEKGGALHRNLTQIDAAAKRAESLTRQLLAFSRKQVMRSEALALNQTVAQLDTMLRRLIGEDIILKTELDPTAGVIMADEGQIEQVIVNIAVNARDAMPEGGRLTIGTRNVRFDEQELGFEPQMAAGPYVQLSICDTGTGMDQQVQAQIFEPFFTTKDKGQGTGLGMSMVYGIVKQSGGEISLYSEPGKGTCFKIYLPRIDVRPASRQKVAMAPEPVCGDETILVVEDEDSVRELVVEALGRCGYHVLSAPDGRSALERYADKASKIDLVLTDMVMPHLNGREFATRFRSMAPGTKVLFMSGYTDDAIIRQGDQAAEMPFIHKPFTLAELTARIRDLLTDA